VAVDQVRGPGGSGVSAGGLALLAASHSAQPQLFHQPLDAAAGHVDAFPVQREPDFPSAVDAVVSGVHSRDLDLEILIAQRLR
jgi:hypothetical protein